MRLAGHHVFHLLDVAVVGGDQCFAADPVQGFDDAADAFVQAFDRLDRRLEHAGVADHVAVGVVDDDHVEALVVDGFDDPVGDFRRAHLRLQVVGGHLRRRNQDAFLAGEGLFAATGEEEGDVGVLLGLGDAQLGLAVVGQVLAEHVGQRLGGEGGRGGNACRVLGEHDEAGQLRHAGPLEAIEVGFDEGAGQFAGAVCAEIHEHHGIAIFHPHRLADGGGLDELVALAALVGGDQAVHRVIGLVLGLAVDDQLISLLHAIPAVVAVHGEVAADQAGDPALAQAGEGGLQQFDGALRALGRRVAAVEEGVQVDLLGTAPSCQLGHGDQVVLMAVHAAIGQQAEDVHGLAAGGGLVHGGADVRVLEEVAVADGLGHASEVLIHHATGAEVHVADFRVAHLPIRQADIHAATRDQAMGLGGTQTVVDRRVGSVDGVVFGAVAVSEAVENDQYQGFGRNGHLSGPCRRARKRRPVYWLAGLASRFAGFSPGWGLCILGPHFILRVPF